VERDGMGNCRLSGFSVNAKSFIEEFIPIFSVFFILSFPSRTGNWLELSYVSHAQETPFIRCINKDLEQKDRIMGYSFKRNSIKHEPSYCH